MDEEQVKALIAAALTEHGTTLLSQIDQKNAGLAASLTREIKKSLESLQPPAKPAPDGTGNSEGNPPEPNAPGTSGATEGKLTLKALQQQLEAQTKLISEMKADSDRKDRETVQAKRSSALAQSIAGAKALNPTLLHKVLQLEYGDGLKEENNAWFVSVGDSVKPLNDAVSAYLQTDEGKAFLPPSGTQGSGASESKTTTATPPTTTPTKAVDALSQAFASY